MKIGDFARLGQVSVRMLRHYDQIGLLRPERVDEWTGHRSYGAEQLATLNRIVALKELGLTLDQVRRVLDDRVGLDELRGMLRLREAELHAELTQGRIRLAGIAHRLRLIESEDEMSAQECVLKSVPAIRLACRTSEVAAQPDIAGVIGPMFGVVATAVSKAGGCPETGVGVYDATENGLSVTAGYLYDGAAADGFEVVNLPETWAATTMHLGTMDGIGASWQALHGWCSENGWTPNGPGRELYIKAPPDSDQSDWVTELQQPVMRS